MIHVLGDTTDPATTEIVVRAFERSFTRGQVGIIARAEDIPARDAIVVAIAPKPDAAGALQRLLRSRGKLILQGPLPPAVEDLAGVTTVVVPPDLRDAACCGAAPRAEMHASRATLDYADAGLGLSSPLRRRAFCRFDFSDEWNNLGFGRIGCGGDRWSIDRLATSCEIAVATVRIGDEGCGAAVTLRELAHGAVLWSARRVGPVDGHDWAVVEHFVSRYRADDLPCRPYLRGIPHGFGAAITMRLDCDEAIASARPLLDLYAARNRPLSLAIATGQLRTPEDAALIADVVRAGGAILSHSVTHAPAWGGSADAAEREARLSKAHLEAAVPEITIRHAVSPFHQTPSYVPGALSLAGYDGFVGGSIASDPEYLMARAGVPPFAPPTIVSHSQSCMLHGDCLLATGDPLRVYKEAFRLARDSSEVFGYLDHPFSARYAYGWASEGARLDAHAALLDHIERSCGPEPLLFINEDDCLRFVRDRAAAIIRFDDRSQGYTISRSSAAGLPLSIAYRGATCEAIA